MTESVNRQGTGYWYLAVEETISLDLHIHHLLLTPGAHVLDLLKLDWLRTFRVTTAMAQPWPST